MTPLRVVPRLLFVIGVLLPGLAATAPQRDVPVTVHQPDGEPLRLLASGDEYYNWLHDATGHTILQDPQSGYWVYAAAAPRVASGSADDAGLQPSPFLVGTVSPERVGLRPGVLHGAARRREMGQSVRDARARPMLARPAPGQGTINNIVVFIRFRGESEFPQSFDHWDGLFNNYDTSLKAYFQEVSRGQLAINSKLYPGHSDGTIVSFEAGRSRAYYQPYNAVTNPSGYTDAYAAAEREHALLKEAIDAVNSAIPDELDVDQDDDGYVDSVVFVVRGEPGAWASLLWSHQWALYYEYATINGAQVYEYSFDMEAHSSWGSAVICHEMFHVLGAPDLYRYEDTSITPVGRYGIMAHTANPPQHMLMHMKARYGGWIGEIPEITANGSYQLWPANGANGNAYRLRSHISDDAYYVLEYRRKAWEGFESDYPGSGIVITRVEPWNGGNAFGPPDEVYVFRPNGWLYDDGGWDAAHFTADYGRTVFGPGEAAYPFLGDGRLDSVRVMNIGSAGDSISFEICVPSCDGNSCGSDGCGGSCACGPGKVCDAGACITCTPDCFGKSCGPDGCGGVCGACGESDTCVDDACELCDEVIHESCDYDFVVARTSPVPQDYVQVTGDWLDWTERLDLALVGEEWRAALAVDDGASLAYKYLISWDGGDEQWCRFFGEADSAFDCSSPENHVVIVDCGRTCTNGCDRACEAMVCGDDGCGGQCPCPLGLMCEAEACVPDTSCDNDLDLDRVCDDDDNCPLIYNAAQDDGDGDGLGDLCDGCRAEPSSCAPDADCTAASGSDPCVCRPGFSGDGWMCVDLDECYGDNGGCAQFCTNNEGGYECSCDPGWLLAADGLACEDINECAQDKGGCEETCTNSAGGYACSCSEGWSLAQDAHACEDIDECADSKGGCAAGCVNDPGGYHCTCASGSTLAADGRACIVDGCDPSCDPGVCGADGCGGTCGGCGAGETCLSGLCTACEGEIVGSCAFGFAVPLTSPVPQDYVRVLGSWNGWTEAIELAYDGEMWRASRAVTDGEGFEYKFLMAWGGGVQQWCRWAPDFGFECSEPANHVVAADCGVDGCVNACAQTCQGMRCGDDGCGGACPCPSSTFCHQGTCLQDGTCINDADGDQVCDEDDNCVDLANLDQADLDGDGLGDVCDCDVDGDEDCGRVDPSCASQGCGGGPATDCDDLDPARHSAAIEACNGIDDDCDDAVDDGADADCDDGDACTLSDICDGGSCVGTHPMVCEALDDCHTVGTCNPDTGLCSTPLQPDLTICDDANACTRDDRCSAGVCVGASPVDCQALDDCHLAGVCEPSTGLCSTPMAPEGTDCDDSDACSQQDRCVAGSCAGASLVVCQPMDDCHLAGVCDPATGACSDPPGPDEAVCDDGDACTRDDRCSAGTCVGQDPVACGASDVCHLAGVCDPSTGLCSDPAAPDETPCDDGDACTQLDGCAGGACVGADSVVCEALDACHGDGTCDPSTGLCSSPALPNETPCDDGDPCTIADACVSGSCVSGAPLVCEALDDCHLPGSCDPATGLCSDPLASDGVTCSDDDLCTQGDECAAGSCVGVALAPDACADESPCTDDACYPDTGCSSVPNTASCDDGNPCTLNVCTNGLCAVTGSVAGCCAAHEDCGEQSLRCDPVEQICEPLSCRSCEANTDCGPVGNRCLELASGSYCGVDCSLGEENCPAETVCSLLTGGLKQCLPAAGDCICEPGAETRCTQGLRVSFDSCGEPGELVEDCGDLGCAAGVCCEAGSHQDGDACVDDIPDVELLPETFDEVSPETFDELSPETMDEVDADDVSEPESVKEIIPEAFVDGDEFAAPELSGDQAKPDPVDGAAEADIAPDASVTDSALADGVADSGRVLRDGGSSGCSLGGRGSASSLAILVLGCFGLWLVRRRLYRV